MWDHPGIGRYVRELTRAAVRLAPGRLTLIGHEASRGAFPKGVAFRPARAGVYSLAEQLELPRAASGFGALHVPHFNVPFAYRGRLVATVHDLIYLHDAKASKRRFGHAAASALFGHIARRAAAVIAVSEATRAELVERFPRLAPRVRVIHEAASPAFRRIEDPVARASERSRLGIEGPFVLHVGTLKPHKNLPFLLEAMDRVREKGLPHGLVAVGRADAQGGPILEALRKRPYARHLGEVSDGDLASLYNLADAFVLPSLVEGFGLPVLEAMACGTPVLVSDRASLPEVAGDAARFFDPLRVDALSGLLYTVLENGELRRAMSSAGLARAERFSWEKAAAETLRVYDEVSA